MRSSYWLDRTKARREENQRGNELIRCPKHGEYCPNERTQYGWVHRDCPACQRERHQAAHAQP